MILAGDVGGTKTQMGIFSKDRGPRQPLFEVQFQNAGYADFESIVAEFLARSAEAGFSLRRINACIGVAGPVIHGQARITNLPWIIGEKQLRDKFACSTVKIINDMEATASAVPLLKPADLLTLNEGQPRSRGNIAVIAPGTGLGEAFSIWDGSRYHVRASEGGHADFAPGDALQISMLRVLQKQGSHVSWESVCSGRGLPRIYEFLKDHTSGEEPAWLSEKLNQAQDRTPVIIAAAMDQANSCDLCAQTLNLFTSILGAEAGNLALKVMATSGVYLAGGIPRLILPFLQKGPFMEAFRHKGRMSDLVSSMPVHVIFPTGAALIGAAACGLACPEKSCRS
jgi:glucokinase